VDEDLVERLAALMLPELGSDVRDWPTRLQDIHRNGQFGSFRERNAAVDMERRRMDARNVLRQLRAEGLISEQPKP
jgi:hypothetical protein